MASNASFLRGQNCSVRIYQGGRNVTVLSKSFNVDENVTESNDDVNGEYRSRLDRTTNYYSMALELFLNDQEQIQMVLDYQANEDAAGFSLPQSCAIQMANRDGSRAAFLCKEARFGPWKMGISGRDDAITFSLGVRFRFFVPLPTI